MKLIFDSNVFDDLLTGKLNIDFINEANLEVFITHIQVDELNECRDKEKRAELFNFLTEIRPKKIPTESFIIGKSRLGFSKLGDGDLIEKLKKENLKNTNDALIGEAAIKNGLTLITNDRKLKNQVNKLGGHSITVDEFLHR